MMRLLFLCMLLLRAAVSEERDGSGYDEIDDEDYGKDVVVNVNRSADYGQDPSVVDKTTGGDDEEENFTMIAIIIAATLLVLSVAAVITALLIRHHMQKRQQGIYSVPTEQNQKRAV